MLLNTKEISKFIIDESIKWRDAASITIKKGCRLRLQYSFNPYLRYRVVDKNTIYYEGDNLGTACTNWNEIIIQNGKN